MAVSTMESRIDISGCIPVSGMLEMAVTVTFPQPVGDRPVTVAFGYPGGGYTRNYYNLDVVGLDGEPQAVFHADRSWIFVACDPLGVGQSSLPDPTLLTLEATAAANHACVTEVLRRLKSGDLVEGLRPVKVGGTVGMGNSLGGMALIAQQGQLHTFEAIAVLGYSAIHTVMPSPEGPLQAQQVVRGTTDKQLDEVWATTLMKDPFAWRYIFYGADVPDHIVQSDLGLGYPERTATELPTWATRSWPGFTAHAQTAGVVSDDAAAITCPVFTVSAEIDVVPDLRAEAKAYSSSPDVTLFELEGAAHLHNFAGTRRKLWRRLHNWVESIVGRAASE